MKNKEIYIGTSGWKYKHWDTSFYPEDLKKTAQLMYYQSKFNTVELNNSFYRQPQGSQFVKWKNAVGSSFLYAVKANRYFTHLKKLKVEPESVHAFLESVACLDEKLGPILFQLPPHWKINSERLSYFIKLLPTSYRYAFEFRNRTWYCEEIYAILKANNCAFVIYELDGHLSPLEVTADFVYIRLHGPGAKYQGSYTDHALKRWAAHCEEWKKQDKTVYLYFDNDQAGYAAFNAITLLDLLKKH
jgi:uncharacterized protein YecE (DUF72 family)